MSRKITNGHDAPLKRRAPLPGQRVKVTDMVKVGGEWVTPRDAAFLNEYLRHFNGSRAALSVGSSRVTAGYEGTRLLKQPKMRAALRGALEEKRRRIEVEVDDVARYWYDVATADPRELSQVVYVPCRYCYGVDHQYQFTDGELRVHRQDHMINQRELPEEHRTPVDELGGPGYTANRYPMRGPDWEARVARVYDAIGRPLPEGLEANSDHSCPECHGDGDRRVWFADTRHLSPEAARLYAGVRVTNTAIEIKTMDRISAMEKFEQLVGMVKPRRVKFDFNLEELRTEELDALLDEARSRGLLSDEEVTRGRLIDATPSTGKSLAKTRA